MLTLKLSKRSQKYLRQLPPKQIRQVLMKVQSLRENPKPIDSKKLIHSTYHRADIGEHRIIYTWSEATIFIALIGKRNDGDVYRKLDRLGG